MRVQFYQNIASPHQVATLRALAKREGVEVSLAVENEQEERRQRMGWVVPDFGQVRTFRITDANHARTIVNGCSRDTIHIFTGFQAYPLVSEACLEACRLGLRVVVMTESYSGYGISGLLRHYRAKLYAHRFRKRVAGVLAMGRLGVDCFVHAGFASEQVFPFGYFVDDVGGIEDMDGSSRQVRLLYLGQFLHTKGPDRLVEALGLMREASWTLKLIGDGVLRQSCERVVSRAGLSSRVTFLGSLGHADAMAELDRADHLVVPSRWDGWGVVINEALSHGVPVVCSDRCGAKDLILSEDYGVVVSSSSPKHLAVELDAVVSQGPVGRARRQRLRRWAGLALSGAAAAEYLAGVLMCLRDGSPRPVPPWLTPCTQGYLPIT